MSSPLNSTDVHTKVSNCFPETFLNISTASTHFTIKTADRFPSLLFSSACRNCWKCL